MWRAKATLLKADSSLGPKMLLMQQRSRSSGLHGKYSQYPHRIDVIKSTLNVSSSPTPLKEPEDTLILLNDCKMDQFRLRALLSATTDQHSKKFIQLYLSPESIDLIKQYLPLERSLTMILLI